MTGRIILENGVEARFSLLHTDIEVLEREAAKVRELSETSGYNAAAELAQGAIPTWIQYLKRKQEKQNPQLREQPGNQKNK